MNGGNCDGNDSSAYLLPLNDTRRQTCGCPKTDDEDNGGGKPLEDTPEWQCTKSTAGSLFRLLGRYYDTAWFPTAVKEWSLLYYRCHHADRYWQYRDEWLAGDEQVRLAVWSEVLKHREKYDRRREEYKKYMAQENKCEPVVDPLGVGAETNNEAARIAEMFETLNQGNDVIELKRSKCQEVGNEDSPVITLEDQVRMEAEEAEIALADPDENPDWVEMRRRMRGSFAALNMAQCDVSSQLLDHIMIELCKYWASSPCTENQVEPLLERNIMREIQYFRHRLFGVAVEEEPERMQSPCPEQEPEEPSEACPEPQPGPSCRKPPPPATAPCRPRSRTGSRTRGPGTTKAAEARAKAAKARMNKCSR